MATRVEPYRAPPSIATLPDPWVAARRGLLVVAVATRLLTGIGLAFAVPLAGCTAIAGITDGQLVEAGAPDASIGDGAVDVSTTDSAVVVESGGDAGGCAAGSRVCDGGCLPIDIHDCAACGNDCTALPHVSSTGLACTAGACAYTCAAGWGDCSHSGSGCATSVTTSSNCGACGAMCNGGSLTLCQNGTCVTSCSGTTPDQCGSTCTNTQTDPQHCGGCNSPCNDTSPNSSATCSGGVCGFQCDATYTKCGNSCVDTATDTANCGMCGHTCPVPANGTTSCSGGSCLPTCPNAGDHDYCAATNVCTSISSDPDNCGTCGTVCLNATVCSAGNCLCPQGWAMCGSACIDLQGSDPNNCGACGHGCQGSTCSNGLCQPTQLATTSGYVFGIGVDSSNVYFTNGAGGGVDVCPLAGCPGTPPVLYSWGGYGGHLVYDVPGGLLYVEDSNNAMIYAITTGGALAYSTGGSPVGGEDAIDGTYVYAGGSQGVNSYLQSSGGYVGDPLISLPGESAPGVWYDPASGNLFIAAYGTPGEILECSTAGVCTHVPGGSTFVGPYTITVQGNTIYFSADGTSAAGYANGGLFAAPVGNPTQVQAIATGPPYAASESIEAITADSSNVYFATGSGIYRSAFGGTPILVVANVFAQVMTTDATFLYFGNGNTLSRVAK